jgi:hypothetical protein
VNIRLCCANYNKNSYTFRTKMLTKYRELCLKAKSLKDELKKKIEQG